MAKFNKDRFQAGAGLLSEISKNITTPQEEEMVIVYKNRHELVPNPLNNYSLQEIDKLADSIRVAGRVRQPIIYLDPPQPDGTYRIISGHRRWNALGLLEAEDPHWADNVPCTPVTLDQVKLPISDASKEMYLIIDNNSSNREKTDADIYNEYKEQKEIFLEAKKNGYSLTGKMRDIIAKEIGLSSAQVGKIEYTEKHAVPAVKDALAKNIIGIADATHLAHQKEEEQRRIMDKVRQKAAHLPIEDNKASESEIFQKQEPDPETSARKEIKKTIRPKIIDSLTENSYQLSMNDIEEITEEVSRISSYADTVLPKNTYAKLLESRKKIMKELQKIEKILANGE